MNTVAIIQARMGSTRFPGKVLKHILGKPMLERMIERVKRAKLIDQIVVATTTNPQDNSITRLTDSLNISSFRGSATDVLSRYYLAAKKYHADIIVRLTGDCPVIDPVIIDTVVKTYLKDKWDYVSNVHIRSFPRGMDTEVFSFRALTTAWKQARSAYNREHITPYIYAHSQLFKLKQVIAPPPLSRPDLRLTVDESADLRLVRKIYQAFYSSHPHFTLLDIIAFLDQNPAIKSINQSIKQKPTPHQRLA